jgi:hypothetical protein
LDKHIASEHSANVKKLTIMRNEQKPKSPGKTRKRKNKTIPRLAENMELINLKLVHKNEHWMSNKYTEAKRKEFKCLKCIEVSTA